jgi:hypothetical protein
MQRSDINFRPPTRTLRQFAGLCLVIFGGLACWQWLAHDNALLAGAFLTLSLTLGVVGLLAPQAVRLVFVGWMVLVFPIGWLVSRLVLGVIFYAVFTPLGLAFRLLGRDALRIRTRTATDTYWVPRPVVSDPRRYFQQF